jgi:hypothetical protein
VIELPIVNNHQNGITIILFTLYNDSAHGSLAKCNSLLH